MSEKKQNLLIRSGVSCVPTIAGAHPFLWEIHDGIFGERLISVAAKSFPPTAWPHWIRYDSTGALRLVANSNPPGECAELLSLMNLLCPSGLVPDSTFYGAGLHLMPPGGFLDVHLDCDRHPMTGYRLAMNLILFLDAWHPTWGGQLELWRADLSAPAVRITPAAGRLVAFECSDISYHGVPEKINPPPGHLRRSLAVYFWEPGSWPSKRLRARFVSVAGDSSGKSVWQQQRAGRSYSGEM